MITLSNFYRGDTKVYTFTVTNATSGNAVDITNWVFWITLKTLIDDADSAAIHQSNVTALGGDATNGIVTFTLTSTETDAIPVGVYKYDIQRVIGGSPPDVETIGIGTVKVLQDITLSNT